MNMLDQVSKDLVDADELGVALTPESISSAQEKLTQEEAGIEARREALLRDIRESTEAHLVEEKVNVPDIGEASQTLVNLQSQQEEVGSAIRQIESRVTELSTVRQLLEDESSKLLRAREAGSVLADLRVTHCPACDRHLDQAPDDCSCYVCGRPVNGQQTVSASRRIEFESEQLQSVREETNQLLRELAEELKAKREVLRDVAEQLIQWKAVMRPVRRVAAALLPPELFFLDVSYGRVQEKGQQLTRLKAVLDQREQLAADIQKGKRRGYKLDCVNGHRKNDTKETRWPSTSTSLTNCWRITRSQKTSLAKTGY